MYLWRASTSFINNTEDKARLVNYHALPEADCAQENQMVLVLIRKVEPELI